MSIAWYIAPFGRSDGRFGPNSVRTCVMADFSSAIAAAGGRWSGVEVLGDCCLVKVQAPPALHTTIGADARIDRIPGSLQLSDSLASLTAPQRTAIRNRVVAMGYSLAELQAALGTDMAAITLGQLLRFCTTRRSIPRYDQALQQIVFDLGTRPCGTDTEFVDAAVT